MGGVNAISMPPMGDRREVVRRASPMWVRPFWTDRSPNPALVYASHTISGGKRRS